MNVATLSVRRSLPRATARLASLDWRSVAAFGLPFTLYLLTLAPTVYNLDSAELTTAAATGGIVRATGYPLYLMIGSLWSRMPVGDVGYRMNLLSAFSGALTIALAERILRRLGVGPWAAFGALGLLACAPYFWGLSLIAEVYTLHTALMAALILLLLQWADDPTPRRLALVALTGGLSVGNHAATVLLIPGVAWFLLPVRSGKLLSPRAVGAAVGAGLLGLAVYFSLPLRYGSLPAFNYAGHYTSAGTFVPVDLHTAEGLWWLVSGQAFAGEMLAYRGAGLWREVAWFGTQLWQAFFGLGIGPALVGAAVLLRRDWRFGGALLLFFLLSAGFYVDYRVVDKATMFLPAYLVWALWLGVGLEALLGWAAQGSTGPARNWGRWLLRGAAVATVVAAMAWNWPLVDLSDDWSARQRGEAILRQAAPNALILGWWDTVPLIEYLQQVEGQRPDVQAINRFLIAPEDLDRLIARQVTRRPVYVDSLPDGLPPSVQAQAAGPLFRLWPHRAPSRQVGARFELRDPRVAATRE